MTPVRGPSAWTVASLGAGETWLTKLSDDERAACVHSTREALRRSSVLEGWTRRDFALGPLAASVDRWRSVLDTGRGFVVIRGIPVEEMSADEVEAFFWGLGVLLGTPGAQNTDGDLLGHVVDMNDAEPGRLYRTSSEIAFHCDAADVVGLLCTATGLRGGESRLASSAAIYNAILERRPDLIGRMYENFWLDAHGQRGMSRVRVPMARHAGDRLRLFYHSDYFRTGGAQSPNGLDDEARELLDLFDTLAKSPAYCLDMVLQPGDIQLVSNHSVVHARGAYDDPPAPRNAEPDSAQRRHLLRLWLSLDSDKGFRARYQKARAWGSTLSSLVSAVASSKVPSTRASRRPAGSDGTKKKQAHG